MNYLKYIYGAVEYLQYLPSARSELQRLPILEDLTSVLWKTCRRPLFTCSLVHLFACVKYSFLSLEKFKGRFLRDQSLAARLKYITLTQLALGVLLSI